MKRGKEGMRTSSQNEQVQSLQNVDGGIFIGTEMTLSVQVSTAASGCLPGDKNAVSSQDFLYKAIVNLVSRGALLRVKKRRLRSFSPGSPLLGSMSMSPFIMSG